MPLHALTRGYGPDGRGRGFNCTRISFVMGIFETWHGRFSRSSQSMTRCGTYALVRWPVSRPPLVEYWTKHNDNIKQGIKQQQTEWYTISIQNCKCAKNTSYVHVQIFDHTIANLCVERSYFECTEGYTNIHHKILTTYAFFSMKQCMISEYKTIRPTNSEFLMICSFRYSYSPCAFFDSEHPYQVGYTEYIIFTRSMPTLSDSRYSVLSRPCDP